MIDLEGRAAGIVAEIRESRAKLFLSSSLARVTGQLLVVGGLAITRRPRGRTEESPTMFKAGWPGEQN